MDIFAHILYLSPPKTKNRTKMQSEQDQKLEFFCLSLHTNFEHEEHEEPIKAITTTTIETPQNPKKKINTITPATTIEPQPPTNHLPTPLQH